MRSVVLNTVVLEAYMAYVSLSIYDISVDIQVAWRLWYRGFNLPPHLSVNMRPVQVVIHDRVVLD
jgi:hypothetical protein